MRTHYDNLKVSETATRDVIKASYRKLCLKHHPDRNQDSEEAKRIMQILNDAYDVLSDPGKRRAYDQELVLRRARDYDPRRSSHSNAGSEPWRRTQEERGYQSHGPQRAYSSAGTPFHAAPWAQRPARSNFVRKGSRFTLGMGMLIVVIMAANVFHQGAPGLPFSGLPKQDGNGGTRVTGAAPIANGALNGGPSSHTPAKSTMGMSLFSDTGPPRRKSAYTRPATAPNGSPWPQMAWYIQGYPQAATAGESRLTLDNTEKADDVFVKLISLRDGKELQVRTCFLPAFTAFTLMMLSPGDYELRYRNLSTGETRKTDVFRLKESRGPLGVNYTTMRLALYKAGEDLHSRQIGDRDF